MIYKIIVGKEEILIDEEEKRFLTENQDRRFIELKTGDIINAAFVQSITIQEELSRQKNIDFVETIKMGEISPEDKAEIISLYSQVGKMGIKKLDNLLEKFNKDLKVQ